MKGVRNTKHLRGIKGIARYNPIYEHLKGLIFFKILKMGATIFIQILIFLIYKKSDQQFVLEWLPG